MASVRAMPMYLGLDLRGGVHFLMQVDMRGALKQAVETYSLATPAPRCAKNASASPASRARPTA